MSDSVLDFSRGVNGAQIKIAVSRNGGQVSGKILAEDGGPLKSSLALVCLAEIPCEAIGNRMKIVENGAEFTYIGLRPGKYHLLAIDAGRPGNWQSAVRALFPKAQEIEIHEGDRIEKDVKVMTKEGGGVAP